MITVRLPNGRVLTFPDGTSKAEIDAAARSATAENKTFDLSGLRQKSPTAAPIERTPDLRAQTESRLKTALSKSSAAPIAKSDTEPAPVRSQAWHDSVHGKGTDSTLSHREIVLRRAEEQGSRAMEDLGFEDHGTGYLNPATGERVLKRRRTGYDPAAEEPTGILTDAKNIASAFVSGIPERIAENVAGYSLPVRAAEAVGSGLAAEARNLIKPDLSRSTGEGLRRGAAEAWENSPYRTPDLLTRAIETKRNELAEAVVGAGLPSEASAALDTSQALAGIVADPSNYLAGAGAIKAGRFLDGAAPASTALSEAAQARLARSGKLGLDPEPLLRYNPHANAGQGGWRGRIPDTIREIRGEPWRQHLKYGDEPVNIDRPTGPEPVARSVDRDPVPVPVEGGSEEMRDRVFRLWDYASRRHPRIAQTFRGIKIVDDPGLKGYFDNGVLVVGDGVDLDTVMHEMTHGAQAARGNVPRAVSILGMQVPPDPKVMSRLESTAMRRGELYDRVPEPRFSRLADPGSMPPRPLDESMRTGRSISRPDEEIGGGPWAGGDRIVLDSSDGDWGQFLNDIGLTDDDVFRLSPEKKAQVDFEFEGWKADKAARVSTRGGLTDSDMEQLAASLSVSSSKRSSVPFYERPVEDIIAEMPQASPDTIREIHDWAVRKNTGRTIPTDEVLDDAIPTRSSQPEVFSDPMEAVFGRETANEYRRLKSALDKNTRDRLAGKAGTLLPHAEDEMLDRLADIRGSVTDEQWGFAVSGQGDVPPLPEGRIFAQEPLLPAPGNMIEPDDLNIANDMGRGRPIILHSDTGAVPTSAPVPEESAAEAMGWKRPMTPPMDTRTASIAAGNGSIDPIQAPAGFQTNIAAQIDPTVGYFGDPEVAGYVIEKSDEIFKAIGPPQTWDTLEEMALRLGTTKDDLLSQPQSWNVMPPEVRLRMLYLIKGHEEQIQQLQGKLAAGAATDTDKAALLRSIDEYGSMIKLGVKSGSAYGRALNSLKMQARLAISPDQAVKQKLYRKYADQIDKDKPILDMLARLDPNNREELQTFLRSVEKPKFREYLQEYWIGSVLSGPATHERNLIGNALNAVMENAVIRPTTALMDRAALARTGERQIFFRETPAAVTGLVVGMRKGIHKGFEVLKRGYDITDDAGKLLPIRSAFGRSQNRVVREVVGPVVTMPLRLLAASDVLFKSMNYTAEIYAQAARTAAKEELTGTAFAEKVAALTGSPTDEMIEAADRFALKATFNDEASAIGSAIMGLRDLPNVEAKTGVGAAGLEVYRALTGFMIPFVKIADRLLVRGLEYTPISAVKAVGAARAGMNAEAADLAARAAIGSTVMAYAASLAMEGRITAGAPTDPAERAAFYGANKQPWAIRTDDGVWIPYGNLQPVGTAFALAATAWKGWTDHEESPDLEKLGHAASEIGVYVTDQSYMDGLSKFMDAISGPEHQRGKAFSDLITGTAGGFTPYSGFTRSVARAVDPRLIATETVKDRLKSNVPVLSLGMDARLDPWGEDVIPTGGRLRSILAPGSILLPSQERQNPLDLELERLGMPLGLVGKTISDRLGTGPSRGTFTLSPDEWYFYQQTSGRQTKKVLERLFAQPGYAKWDTEKQRDAVSKAIGMAREYGRIQTVRRHRGKSWR